MMMKYAYSLQTLLLQFYPSCFPQTEADGVRMGLESLAIA